MNRFFLLFKISLTAKHNKPVLHFYEVAVVAYVAFCLSLKCKYKETFLTTPNKRG